MLRVSLMLMLIGAGMGVIGGGLLGVSVYLTASEAIATDSQYVIPPQAQPPEAVAVEGNRRRLPTLTPTPVTQEIVVINNTSTPQPTATASPSPTQPPPTLDQSSFDNVPEQAVSETTSLEVDASLTETVGLTTTGALTVETASSIATDTLAGSSPDVSNDVTPEPTRQTEEEIKYVEPYTSTDQVKPPPSANTEPEISALSCPTQSNATFDLIPIEGRPMTDHPDALHGDLNLSLRGYTRITDTLALIQYNGNTDPNAPRLHGLFEPNRVPKIRSVYQVNEWVWDSAKCGGQTRGCRGSPIDVFWPVTLVGLNTTPGELINVPERGPEIHPGGYVALVLYAEKRRVTLGYTRRDTVVSGYTVHLENLCVDPNLLALYQAQRNADGWHTSGFLPGLRNNQALGVALSQELQVAIRDAGSFMDPRSDKDWWR